MRSPTSLIPCLLDLLRDDEAGHLKGNLDLLGLFVEWGSDPDIEEDRTLPENLTGAGFFFGPNVVAAYGTSPPVL